MIKCSELLVHDTSYSAQHTHFKGITDQGFAHRRRTARSHASSRKVENRMFTEKHVQYFMGKAKRVFGLAKTQREGAKTQREGADKLEALGHELEAKADEIETQIQQDKRK